MIKHIIEDIPFFKRLSNLLMILNSKEYIKSWFAIRRCKEWQFIKRGSWRIFKIERLTGAELLEKYFGGTACIGMSHYQKVAQKTDVLTHYCVFRIETSNCLKDKRLPNQIGTSFMFITEKGNIAHIHSGIEVT